MKLFPDMWDVETRASIDISILLRCASKFANILHCHYFLNLSTLEKARNTNVMPALFASGSEPKESCSTAEERRGTLAAQPSSKESARDIFRENQKRRRSRRQSRKSSSPPSSQSSSGSQAKPSDSNPHESPFYGPRPNEEEESKFGESLVGLMQRSGRFDYCEFGDGVQMQNGSVRRLMGVRVDLDTVNRTWRNLTNQTPRIIGKALGSRFRR